MDRRLRLLVKTIAFLCHREPHRGVAIQDGIQGRLKVLLDCFVAVAPRKDGSFIFVIARPRERPWRSRKDISSRSQHLFWMASSLPLLAMTRGEGLRRRLRLLAKTKEKPASSLPLLARMKKGELLRRRCLRSMRKTVRVMRPAYGGDGYSRDCRRWKWSARLRNCRAPCFSGEWNGGMMISPTKACDQRSSKVGCDAPKK